MAPQSTQNSHPWRYLTALIVILIAMVAAVLSGNILKPADWHKSFVVGRGLDLSSGTSITLKAQLPDGKIPSQGSMTKAKDIITSRVESTGLTGATVVQQGSNQIVVSVPGAGAQKVATLVGETAELRLRQVLLYAPNDTASTSATPSTSTTPKVKAKSTASPSASVSPTPSSGSGQAVGASQLGAAAKASPSPSASASTSPAASASPSASTTPSGKEVLSTTADGEGDASVLSAAAKHLFDVVNCDSKTWQNQIYHGVPSNWDNPNVQTVTCYDGYKYALNKAVVLGTEMSGVQAVDETSGWVVEFNVKGQASKNLATLTTTMVANYYDSTTDEATSPLDLLAVVLDGNLQGQPPQVTQAITTGSGEINGGTGGFTQAQASSLADVLKYGSLPLSFQNLYTSSVSPALGSDQLSAGLFAAVVGLALVVIYSFLYYRGLGLVSVLSLAIAASTTYLAVVLLSKHTGFTLDLAGIAGLVVAIGITADSFIVYFERLRDEVREGRSLRAAVERGWARARRTILVSDTVSFLAALLLYILSEGDVRGFAFTLGLTTLVDVLVVFLFTKPMITLLARTTFYGQGHKLSGLDPNRLGARAPWRGGRRAAAAGTGSAGPGSGQARPRTQTTTREA